MVRFTPNSSIMAGRNVMLTNLRQLGTRTKARVGVGEGRNLRRMTILLCLVLCFSLRTTRRAADRALSPVSIECFPTRITLTGPGAKHSLIVSARMADGSAADFTKKVR